MTSAFALVGPVIAIIALFISCTPSTEIGPDLSEYSDVEAEPTNGNDDSIKASVGSDNSDDVFVANSENVPIDYEPTVIVVGGSENMLDSDCKQFLRSSDPPQLSGYFDEENRECIAYTPTENDLDKLLTRLPNSVPEHQFPAIKIKLISYEQGDPSRYNYSSKTKGFVVSTDLDCADFLTKAEAQAALANGDPHGLDGDNDGEACEWGVNGSARKVYKEKSYESTYTSSGSSSGSNTSYDYDDYDSSGDSSGSNCHWVKPYTRDDGTRVKGHKRCRR